jgi:hypothetical protein
MSITVSFTKEALFEYLHEHFESEYCCGSCVCNGIKVRLEVSNPSQKLIAWCEEFKDVMEDNWCAEMYDDDEGITIMLTPPSAHLDNPVAEDDGKCFAVVKPNSDLHLIGKEVKSKKAEAEAKEAE